MDQDKVSRDNSSLPQEDIIPAHTLDHNECLSSQLNLLLTQALRRECANQSDWNKFAEVGDLGQWEQEAVNKLLVVVQSTCAELVKTAIKSVKENPLENSLVLKRLFRFACLENLKAYRLVNCLWNREASLHFQKRKTVWLTAPFTIKTREFLSLVEQFHTLEDNHLEWPFASVWLKIGDRKYNTDPLPDLKTILKAISGLVKWLGIRLFPEFEEWTCKMPDITFNRLVHLSCDANNFGGEHQLLAWVVNKSPILKSMCLELDRRFAKYELREKSDNNSLYTVFAKEVWPLLDLLARNPFLKLESLELNVQHNNYDRKDLTNLIAFLLNQSRYLKFLDLRTPYKFQIGHGSALIFPKLMTLKANNAAVFFENPKTIPCVSNLDLHTDYNFEEWLKNWNGQPVFSLEMLKFKVWIKEDSSKSKMAKLFPKLRRLELYRDMSKETTLSNWVFCLEHLVELTFNVLRVDEFCEIQPQPHPAFTRLQILRVRCTSGKLDCIPNTICRKVFLKLDNLKRLELFEDLQLNDYNRQKETSEPISLATLHELGRKFSFTYRKIRSGYTRELKYKVEVVQTFYS